MISALFIVALEYSNGGSKSITNYFYRFDRVTNTPLKEAVASYIWRKFGMLGFLTGVQTFEPRQFLKMHPGGVPTGTNLLGILPGTAWGTSEDR